MTAFVALLFLICNIAEMDVMVLLLVVVVVVALVARLLLFCDQPTSSMAVQVSPIF